MDRMLHYLKSTTRIGLGNANTAGHYQCFRSTTESMLQRWNCWRNVSTFRPPEQGKMIWNSRVIRIFPSVSCDCVSCISPITTSITSNKPCTSSSLRDIGRKKSSQCKSNRIQDAECHQEERSLYWSPGGCYLKLASVPEDRSVSWTTTINSSIIMQIEYVQQPTWSTKVQAALVGVAAFRRMACRWWWNLSLGLSLELSWWTMKHIVLQSWVPTIVTKIAMNEFRRPPFLALRVKVAPRIRPFDQFVHAPRYMYSELISRST